MDKELETRMQESEEEWAKIQKEIALREKKDQRIISEFCASNDPADIVHSIELLEKFPGMPIHDKEAVDEFKEVFPKKLTVPILHKYLDVKDIYREFLESGEENI